MVLIVFKLATKALAADWLTCNIADQFAGGDEVGTMTSAGVEDHAAHDENDAILRRRETFHLSEGGRKTGNPCDVTGWGAGG
jgi:hypothetical protein